jgi:hypothetical protein
MIETRTVTIKGNIEYKRNGKLHRTDGPALIINEHKHQCRVWYKNGKLHRDNGPAFDSDLGTKIWYKNGLKHRTDGPAIECKLLGLMWFIDGVEYTYKEWLNQIEN